MEELSIHELFDRNSFDPYRYLKEIKRIGSFTAIRNHKGLVYQRNYERGLLFIFLCKMFKPSNFLEVGCGRGFVCASITKFFPKIKITTIDKDIEFSKKHIEQAGISMDSMKFIHKRTKDVGKEDLNSETFDLSFVDAGHTYEYVSADYKNFSQSMNPSGIMVFDDYSKKFPGIVDFVNNDLKGNKILVYTDGWYYENVAIHLTGNANRIVNGREEGSGIVILLPEDESL